MRLLIFYFLIILLAGCQSNSHHEKRVVSRAFYYWKSAVRLSSFEKKETDSLHANTIYLKFFDVNWNSNTGKPAPVAQVTIDDTSFLKTKKIIPVVFITNECIFKLDSLQAIPLAENIYKLITDIIRINHLSAINEIQIDCDWSSTTKDKYFSILKKIRSLAAPLTISATIRLHQIKFILKSGVPPVDRGLLMCYNMGNLKDPATLNSILETNELKKYTGSLSTYPLPLDIALPLFEWKVLFRNNIYKGLIQTLPDSLLTSSFTKKEKNRITILKDTLLAGYDLKKNDVLRNEKSDYPEIISTAEEINKLLLNNTLTVSLFHLDSLTLSKYSTYELENIYSSFR